MLPRSAPVFFSNLVEEFDAKFASKHDYVFDITKMPLLAIAAKCQVVIAPATSQQVRVEIDADPDDMKDIKVSQTGDTVRIRDERHGTVISDNGGIVISGGSVSISNISGGNVSIINGRVFINGVEQKPNGGSLQKSKKPEREPRIRIYAPFANLDAQMSGESLLVSTQALATVDLTVSGQSKVGLFAESLEASVSGQSKLELWISGGALELDVSGQSNADIKGNWSQARLEASGQSRIYAAGRCEGDCRAEVSGMARIQTEGRCDGDYRADASGMSHIGHIGFIGGRVKQDSSGTSSIKLG